ncbi:hypothetical protein N8851_02905 [Schleiferiaceae bacterium]|nr:hypothetical protein [Schleiferiaceae bacterium]
MEVYKYRKAILELKLQIVRMTAQIETLSVISCERQLKDVFESETEVLKKLEVDLVEFYSMIRKLHGDEGDTLEHLSDRNKLRLLKLMIKD